MNISSTSSGANINVGVVSRPVFGADDDSGNDNGQSVNGKQDSFRSDFRSLLQAVQSGDMASAQSALASIQSDVASASATYSPSSVPPVDPASTDASVVAASSTASPVSTISSDLKALFDAVGSGDATSAQAALSKFVTDRQAAWQQAKGDGSSSQGQQQAPGVHGHHGHRHHGLESVIASLFSGASSTSDASTDSTTDTTTASDPNATPATTAA